MATTERQLKEVGSKADGGPRRGRRRVIPARADAPGAGRAVPALELVPGGESRAAEVEEQEVVASPPRHHEMAIRAVNIAVALLALVVLAPFALLIAVIIKLDSKGPVFYRQMRIGLDRRRPRSDAATGRRAADMGGRPFTIYKFRTMRIDAEDGTGPVWASREDSRTTRVGRFLRRYRLDEIPQFLNVLKGDMSVVGPRPERPSFVQRLRREIDDYGLRQRVKPGITGWAQVNQEPDQTMDDVRCKLQYDLEYLRNRSLSFDLRIMLRTLPVMLEAGRFFTRR